MSEPAHPPRPSDSGARTRLVIGGLSLTGPAALIVALLLLGLFVWLIVWSRPSLGMLLAGGIWLGFVVFWSATAHTAGTGRSEETPRSRATRQQLMNLGLLLLFVPIPGLRWHYLPPNAWHVPAGLGIMAAATLLHIWARAHLGRNWSSEVMIRPDHDLVRTGPYRILRHPIYTAILGLAAGTALVSGRVLSLVGAALFAYVYVRKLRLEEKALGGTFGAAWDDYRRHSWALVPGVF
ncbi:MAG TPA: isoprenylcysteine carboxylmethyltransferase family protein [Candidatus Eisenbacteria bacterium]